MAETLTSGGCACDLERGRDRAIGGLRRFLDARIWLGKFDTVGYGAGREEHGMGRNMAMR